MFNISGGQLQRLAISRALYESKSILLLDETLSSLDSVNKLKILTTLENLVKTKKITVIIVSHDKEVINNKYNIINI
jgi:ABC-type dipeptide/oligopeptide/nickel transport system ATPase subunit